MILRPSEWKEKPPARPQRGRTPIKTDNTKVKPRPGRRIGRVLWRGKQWSVTNRGIECLDGSYSIAKDRLLENIDTYGWPLHMTSKPWVDKDDFLTAFLVALSLHGDHAARLNAALARSLPQHDSTTPYARGTEATK